MLSFYVNKYVCSNYVIVSTLYYRTNVFILLKCKFDYHDFFSRSLLSSRPLSKVFLDIWVSKLTMKDKVCHFISSF